jgi:hypothetical protein
MIKHCLSPKWPLNDAAFTTSYRAASPHLGHHTTRALHQFFQLAAADASMSASHISEALAENGMWCLNQLVYQRRIQLDPTPSSPLQTHSNFLSETAWLAKTFAYTRAVRGCTGGLQGPGDLATPTNAHCRRIRALCASSHCIQTNS